MNMFCTGCAQSVRRYDAVLRGDGRELHAWHPICFERRHLPAYQETSVALLVGTNLGETL